jgi:hypothetical protein
MLGELPSRGQVSARRGIPGVIAGPHFTLIVGQWNNDGL